MNKRTFEKRYIFEGKLSLKAGLHVGSGWETGSTSVNPVLRMVDGRPFIPGSSLKGSFRSTVEKLTETVGLKTCLLMSGQKCIGAQGEEQEAFNKRREQNQGDWPIDKLLTELNNNLCDTCKLFGSPYMASHIFFGDMHPISSAQSVAPESLVQVRDGVAIERDSETAVDRLKFDYEVVAPALEFGLYIRLDDPSEYDLALTCMGLNEFVSGFAYLGGKRSRGLGNCQVVDLRILELDLTVDDSVERASRLRKYLLGNTAEEKMTVIQNTNEFVEQQIDKLPIFSPPASEEEADA